MNPELATPKWERIKKDRELADKDPTGAVLWHIFR
jgi:hypothetical protein